MTSFHQRPPLRRRSRRAFCWSDYDAVDHDPEMSREIKIVSDASNSSGDLYAAPLSRGEAVAYGFVENIAQGSRALSRC